jgi:hypothetical protein
MSLVYVQEAGCFLCWDTSEDKEIVDVWQSVIDWMQSNDDKLLSIVNLIA